MSLRSLDLLRDPEGPLKPFRIPFQRTPKDFGAPLAFRPLAGVVSRLSGRYSGAWEVQADVL